MKIKTIEADKPLLEWLDRMARYYRRSRSQQILWLLRRPMVIQQEEVFSTVSKVDIFNGNKIPRLTQSEKPRGVQR